MKLVGQRDLRVLRETAADSPRSRSHHLVHDSHEDSVQRMVIVLDPDTYVPPHRHTAGGRWEILSLIQGRAVALVFDDEGVVQNRVELSADSNVLVEIPEAAWHSLVSLEEGTTMLEIKPGPFAPLEAGDVTTWAPKEGEEGVQDMVRWLGECKVGDPVSGLMHLHYKQSKVPLGWMRHRFRLEICR